MHAKHRKNSPNRLIIVTIPILNSCPLYTYKEDQLNKQYEEMQTLLFQLTLCIREAGEDFV